MGVRFLRGRHRRRNHGKALRECGAMRILGRNLLSVSFDLACFLFVIFILPLSLLCVAYVSHGTPSTEYESCTDFSRPVSDAPLLDNLQRAEVMATDRTAFYVGSDHYIIDGGARYTLRDYMGTDYHYLLVDGQIEAVIE